MTAARQSAALAPANEATRIIEPCAPTLRVLIVDDQLSARKVLAAMLAPIACCSMAASAAEALQILQGGRTDAVISDLRMPGISGLELLAAVRRLYPHLAFLLATGVDEIRVGVQAMQQGADDYLVKPFDVDTVVMGLQRALHQKSLEREVANYRLHLEDMVSERTLQLQTALRHTEESYEDTLAALGAVIDLRDSPTGGHSRRVFLYSMELAKSLGCAENRLRDIAMGAWLHDIGKLAIADRILLKPGPLTPDEWQVMRRHSRIGYDLVKSIAFLADAAEIVLSHHERFNGSGYPQGLAAEKIPLGARIFAVADTVDAMTSDRPYRAALPFQSAREVIAKGSGILYDPQIAAAFLNLPNEAWQKIAKDAAKVQATQILAAGPTKPPNK
ncbi:MAG: HD domain-containing phosphohydrolase [Candidatus Acidiferrales bacterium]